MKFFDATTRTLHSIESSDGFEKFINDNDNFLDLEAVAEGGLVPAQLRRTTGGASGVFFSTADKRIHEGGFTADESNSDLVQVERTIAYL